MPAFAHHAPRRIVASTVRHQTHVVFPGSEDSHQYAIADVMLDGPMVQDEAHAFLTDGGVLYMFPLPKGRVLVAADVASHHDGAAETPPLEEIQSLVAKRGPAGTRVSEPRWLSYFRIHYRLARHYRHGHRIFLAGDAVHVHSPVGGQGMNTGIQDAYNLGWKLALVARGFAPPSLLETYEAERRAVAEDLVKWTRTITERSEAFAGMSHALRERLYMNAVVPDAEARRIARHSEELDLDYRRSAICAEHRPRGRASGLHAGMQALDAGPLQYGDRRLTLFDLLRGPRHALLLFPGPRAGGAAWRRHAGLAASLGRSHGELIDVHVVGAPPADLEGEVPIVLDPEGALHRRYGIRGESLYLIRPDGYVGYRSAPIAPRHLRAYLGRLFLSDGRA